MSELAEEKCENTPVTEIYIDADACPVKDETLRVAERHNLRLHVGGNTWLRKPDGPLVNKVVVPEGPDVADDWIAEHVGLGDICITGDIPLAGRCIEKARRRSATAASPSPRTALAWRWPCAT